SWTSAVFSPYPWGFVSGFRFVSEFRSKAGVSRRGSAFGGEGEGTPRLRRRSPTRPGRALALFPWKTGKIAKGLGRAATHGLRCQAERLDISRLASAKWV